MTDEDNKKPESDFRRAMRGVKPLQDNGKANLRKEPKPILKRRSTDADIAPRRTNLPRTPRTHLSAEDTIQFTKPGLQTKLQRQFENGRIPIEAVLDLHGQTIDQADLAIHDFVSYCVQRKLRCVHIIHGKGYHSASDRTTLKSYVNLWLSEFPEVLAYASCQAQHGGKGAVYVLLKTSAQNS